MKTSFSIIMQSYLDIYNGSRKDPEKKFIRSVNSFLTQKHKDNELIIISDDCDITEKLYFENFKDIKNIVYERVENKERKRMYDGAKKNLFFRGYPRSVGQELAKKEVIGYLDSDDLILSNHLSNIEKAWSLKRGFHMISNSYEMQPLNILHPNGIEGDVFATLLLNGIIVNLKNYGVNEYFCAHSFDPAPPWADGNYIMRTSTYSNFHLSSLKSRWCDSIGTGEDGAFANKISDEITAVNGKQLRVNSPTYVVCHRYNDALKWDY